MKILSNTHNLLIVRRLLPPPPILLILCCFAACSEDSPVALEPTNLVETRTAADSTAVSDSIVVPIQVDTVWADTLYYDYDGNPIESPVEFNINDIETNDAAEAV